MSAVNNLTMAELQARLENVLESPKDAGPLEMIVRRPAVGVREVLSEGELDVADGLVGDTWNQRPSSRTPDGSPHPDMQLTVINARLANLVAQTKERWPLAGDQLFVDVDVSQENLPPGTRLAIGSAIVEVTPQPHTGCAKFVARFGLDAMKFVNSPLGRQLQLRGLYARVERRGVIRIGDVVKKLAPSGAS
jgi:MOSC domain-containing protein YiiM